MSQRSRPALRILDAALNRALEASRVLDDAARFLLDDPTLVVEAKEIRHMIRAIAEAMPGAMRGRDVEGDVGTGSSTASERLRRSPADVVHAAGHRLAESLRSIEEWGKLVDPDAAEMAKALRYRGYALHQSIVARVPGRTRQWRLCVLITESICRHPWLEVVDQAIDGGADCVQLREKRLPDRVLLDRASELVDHVAGRADVIVNDRVDIALLAGADGVHLGTDDLDVAAARALGGHTLIVGCSTHSLDEAHAAIAAGADVIGIGTMFASRTKARPVAGPTLLTAVLAEYPDMPHLAIGGIDAENVHRLCEHGARGVAVSAAICGADDPQSVARAIACAMSAG